MYIPLYILLWIENHLHWQWSEAPPYCHPDETEFPILWGKNGRILSLGDRDSSQAVNELELITNDIRYLSFWACEESLAQLEKDPSVPVNELEF